MPVHNAAPYVREAVDSILSGSYRQLELLAINDGSTDESEAVLRSINDPRLRIVNNPLNLGVVATLNRGLDMADGEYVARMDADDVSQPTRLERQMHFMDGNPLVGVCGTWIKAFGGRPDAIQRMPLGHADIYTQLFAFNPLAHPTVMCRLKLFREHLLRYSPAATHAEDLDLWMRAAEHFKLANLPIVALHYRVHPNQVTRMQSAAQMRSVDMLRLRQLERLIPHAGAEETLLHLTLFDVARHLSVGDLQLTKSWLDRLLAANDAAGLYDVRRFRAFLAARWLNAAHRCSEAGTRAWKVLRSSQLAASGGGGFRLLMKKMLGDRG